MSIASTGLACCETKVPATSIVGKLREPAAPARLSRRLLQDPQSLGHDPQLFCFCHTALLS